jgi:hypothetical protein
MAPAPNRRALGLLVAWILLDVAMGVYLWLNGPSTVSRLLLAAGIAFLLYVLIRRPREGAGMTLGGLEMALAAVLAVELVVRLLVPYRAEPPAPTVPIAAIAGVALVALALAIRGASANRASLVVPALGVVVLASLVARFAIIAWDVEPGFDVHLIQKAAGEALLAGQNPYLTHVYDSGYPYWPVAAILAAGGLLLGDARWLLIAGDALTVVAFVAIARNLGAQRSLGLMAAAVLIWNPSGLYMTWQSMPEAAVIGLAATSVALLTRPRPRAALAGAVLGLSIATKQLAMGLLPFLPLSRERGRWTAFGVAAAVTGVIVAVFLVLNPAAFLEGSVSSHLVEPSRGYAVNLLDPLPGVIPRLNVPFVVTGGIAVAIGLLVRLRWPDSIDGWLASSAALLAVAFTMIGIAFVNYYQIPLALVLILMLVPDGWTPGSREPRAA